MERTRFVLLVACLFDFFLALSANSEGDTLIVFKSSVTDPYNVMASWDATLVNPCTWLHITCNIDDRVVRIDLQNADLTGRLVPQLGSLRNLQYLELFGNNLSGHIPAELGNLTNLVSLDLFQNKLTGSIPDTLGKLKKMRFLRLNHNTLSGKIPYSLTAVASLEVLDLSNNNLSGHIPVNGSFSFFTPVSFRNNPHLVMSGTRPPPIVRQEKSSSLHV